MTNTYEQQQIDLVAKVEALESQAVGLECANKSMREAIDDEFENGTGIDIIWMTRDEMKEYSDVHQAGGIPSKTRSSLPPT